MKEMRQITVERTEGDVAVRQVWETDSPEETFQLGKQLGEACVPGEVYTLTGDLGTGKTVFAQGFAAGLGISEPVCSPTFTILQVYEEGRLPFYHFDVYRIGCVEEMDEIGYEDCDREAGFLRIAHAASEGIYEDIGTGQLGACSQCGHSGR